MCNRTTEKISLLGLKKALERDFQAVSSDNPLRAHFEHSRESRPKKSKTQRKNTSEQIPNSRLYRPPEQRPPKSPLKSPERYKSPQRGNYMLSPDRMTLPPFRYNYVPPVRRPSNAKTISIDKAALSPQRSSKAMLSGYQKSPQRSKYVASNMARYSSSSPSPVATKRPDWFMTALHTGEKKKRHRKYSSPSPHREISQGSVRTKYFSDSRKNINFHSNDYNIESKRQLLHNHRNISVRNRSGSSKRFHDSSKIVSSNCNLRDRTSAIELVYSQLRVSKPPTPVSTPVQQEKTTNRSETNSKQYREKELKEGRLVIVKRGANRSKYNSVENFKDDPETAVKREDSEKEFLIDNDDIEIIDLKPQKHKQKKHKRRSAKHKARREIHDREIEKKSKEYKNRKMAGFDDISDGYDLSDPSECLAEFLSSIMQRRYEDALRYCKLILKHEPDNMTAKEFYPLLAEKLKMKNQRGDSGHSPERFSNEDSQLNLNTDKDDNTYASSDVSSVLDEEWPMDPETPDNACLKNEAGDDVDTDNNPATDGDDSSDDNGNLVAPKDKPCLGPRNDTALILNTSFNNYQGGDSKKSDYKEEENIRKLRAQFLKA